MLKQLKQQFDNFKHWMAYSPPGALSSNGWRSFSREFKERAPVRYYFDHTFMSTFVYPLKWKIRDIKYWVRYRTYDRYHIIKTGLEPGYYSVDTQMLNGSFNLLKDFVEIELAWNSHLLGRKPRIRWLWKEFRSPAEGIANLEWASTLDDPSLPPFERSDHQARAARETLILYKWWTEDRPARVPIEIVPRRHSDEFDIFGDGPDPDPIEEAKNQKERIDNMNARQAQDEKWELEDTEMLCRLMRVRGSLWT